MKITLNDIIKMGNQIVAYWKTPEGEKACRESKQPLRDAVELLFPEWEKTYGHIIVEDTDDGDVPAYDCLLEYMEFVL